MNDTRDQELLQPRANYQYRPLDRPRAEIRLLEVLPSLDPDCETLNCTIRHASLLEDPSYETISYVWGNPAKTHQIQVDETVLAIPENTWKVLRKFRHSSHLRTLWIDAVCINQADLNERSWQVALMGRIYSQCSCGLIYLGDASDAGERTFLDIVAVGEECRHIEGLRGRARGKALADLLLEIEFEQKGLEDLFGCAWFQRVWITQEAVLAPRSVCFYGNGSIDLGVFLIFFEWLDTSAHQHKIGAFLYRHPAIQSTRDITQFRIQLEDGGRISLSVALENRRHLRASDQRDRVYGILGMMYPDEALPALLAVDYSKSPVAVIRDATRYCIEEGMALNTLKYVTHYEEGRLGMDARPSWLPDFEGTHRHPPWIRWLPGQREAALSISHINMWNESSDPDVLAVKAVLVGRIATTCHLKPLRTALPAILAFAASLDISGTQRMQRAPVANSGWDYTSFNPDDRDLLTDLNDYLQSGGRLPAPNFIEIHPDVDNRPIFRYGEAMMEFGSGRQLLATEGGSFLGLGPRVARAGDVLMATTQLGPWVFAARELDDGTYHLLGDCYVDELRTADLIAGFVQGKQETVLEIR